MSTVHFVGGEKGGVGKSVVARVLAQSCIDRMLKFEAVDADTSHPALLRYYTDYTHGIDLEQFSSADQILDRALGADCRVIVDLPAQSLRLLKRWIDSGDVLAYARENDVRMLFWYVSDGGFDSITHLGHVLDVVGNFMDIVVVKNYGRSRDFGQLDHSPIRERLFRSGGRIVELSELDPSIMYKIDRFGSSFWAAVNAPDSSWSLSPMERRRAKLWLDRAYAALDIVDQWVGSSLRASEDANTREPQEQLVSRPLNHVSANGA